jgi:hypothetical protein
MVIRSAAEQRLETLESDHATCELMDDSECDFEFSEGSAAEHEEILILKEALQDVPKVIDLGTFLG